MAPNPRVVNAFRAMKNIGINEEQTKPVLKNLLKLYDKNWELIEAENYRVLADAIFDEEDKVVEQKKCKSVNNREEDQEEETQASEEPERPLKRLRLRGQENQALPSPSSGNLISNGPPIKVPKVEEGEIPESDPLKQRQLCSNKRSEIDPCSSRLGDKGKQPLSSQVATRAKIPVGERASHGVRFKEPVVEPSIVMSPKPRVHNPHALIKPKDEPFTDDMLTADTSQDNQPIAVVHPAGNGSIGKQDGLATPMPQIVDGATRAKSGDCAVASCRGTITGSELATISDGSAPSLEIASSLLGEVKISLSCNSAIGRPDFHMPSRDAVIKYMEEKCLRTYKIIDPMFSVMKLLTDMCDCFLDLATDSADKSQEGTILMMPPIDVVHRPILGDDSGVGASVENSNLLMMPLIDVVQRPILGDESGVGASAENLNVHSSSLNDQVISLSSAKIHAPQVPEVSHSLNGLDDHIIESDSRNDLSCNFKDNGKELEFTESTDSRSMVIVQTCEPNDLRSFHDINDITKGEERVQISWVNEVNGEHLPSFHYIPHNLVFQNARVNFPLSRIGKDNCCPTCFGDCLMASTPCACACKTGGEYAYTPEGLIKESFLEKCICLIRDRQGKPHFYCEECPLERLKNNASTESCKGHFERKLIKECWRKCGCHKQCGNRVVQRGITCNLQVFLTPEGKGWGLRILEGLPKGAFVCEYVGEILTCAELCSRNRRSDENTSAVFLDAYWEQEGVLKDDQALCLDSTYYGNVAKFINHRCYDANLVEVAVQIETPDHHFYHLAFFTARKVDAMEELTWDYGIDFADDDHPVKSFHCRCGSKFCRNIKNMNGSKSPPIQDEMQS